MWITKCTLTLHESLFFATRELGRLYETGRYLHNYALTYAFGLVQTPFHIAESAPYYAELEALNQDGLYVTPAQPVDVRFQITTFKYGEEILHVEMEQATRNTPSFGRAKELAVNSRFQCYILSQESLLARLPRWIRLGKWMSKTEVQYIEYQATPQTVTSGECPVPLNPRDVPATALQTFDIISMPPSSLVANARVQGPCYPVYDWSKTNEKVQIGVLPSDLKYVVAS